MVTPEPTDDAPHSSSSGLVSPSTLEVTGGNGVQPTLLPTQPLPSDSTSTATATGNEPQLRSAMRASVLRQHDPSTRQDSIAGFIRDEHCFIVEAGGRVRSSFSFGGSHELKSLRRNSAPSPPENPEGVLSSQSSTGTGLPSFHASPLSGWLPRQMHQFAMEFFNTEYPPRAYRAIEVCDLEATPVEVRQACQDVLTKQWTRKLDALQPDSPAVTACKQLLPVIDEVSRLDKRKLAIFEFAAGSGGPTPVFEQLVNKARRAAGEPPLQFCISDLHPNLKAWKDHMSNSEHMAMIDGPVDATNPPRIARNDDDKRIFRLFNLSFHHFDDETAIKLLENTIETSDGIAIIELQDRRLGCLLMMFFNVFFIWMITPFWQISCGNCWKYNADNIMRNMRLYFRTLYILWRDGLASCLRTRSYEEFQELVVEAERRHGEVKPMDHDTFQSEPTTLTNAHWRWNQHPMVLHTWPFGYVRMYTGIRVHPARHVRFDLKEDDMLGSEDKVSFGGREDVSPYDDSGQGWAKSRRRRRTSTIEPPNLDKPQYVTEEPHPSSGEPFARSAEPFLGSERMTYHHGKPHVDSEEPRTKSENAQSAQPHPHVKENHSDVEEPHFSSDKPPSGFEKLGTEPKKPHADSTKPFLQLEEQHAHAGGLNPGPEEQHTVPEQSHADPEERQLNSQKPDTGPRHASSNAENPYFNVEKPNLDSDEGPSNVETLHCDSDKPHPTAVKWPHKRAKTTGHHSRKAKTVRFQALHSTPKKSHKAKLGRTPHRKDSSSSAATASEYEYDNIGDYFGPRYFGKTPSRLEPLIMKYQGGVILPETPWVEAKHREQARQWQIPPKILYNTPEVDVDVQVKSQPIPSQPIPSPPPSPSPSSLVRQRLKLPVFDPLKSGEGTTLEPLMFTKAPTARVKATEELVPVQTQTVQTQMQEGASRTYEERDTERDMH